MMKIGRYAAVLLAFGLLVTILTGCSKKEEPPKAAAPDAISAQPPAVAKKAPDFTAKTVDGQTVSLSGLKGKVVLLDFWATWCPPCQASIPHLVKLQEKHGDKGLVVLGLSLDMDETAVKNFLKKTPVNYKMAMSPPDAKNDYRVSSIPRMFVIDREGVIKGDFLGYSTQIGDSIENVALAALNR